MLYFILSKATLYFPISRVLYYSTGSVKHKAMLYLILGVGVKSKAMLYFTQKRVKQPALAGVCVS